MSRQSKWVGIDTSTRTFAICVLDGEGRVVDSAELAADVGLALDYLSHHSETIQAVALETGRTSIHLARSLLDAGYPVRVYDALRVHRFLLVRTNKTDTNDAKGIAEFGRIAGETSRPVYLKPLELALVREKLVIRERLIRFRNQNEKALMNILNGYGVRAAESITSFDVLRRNVLTMLDMIEANCKSPIRAQIIPLLEISQLLRQHEGRLKREISDYAKKSQVCRRMMGVPGVGPITAVSFVTAVGDPSRFSNTADVGAYLGLTPRLRQTGLYSKPSKISKRGNSLTRRHLHVAARAAINCKSETKLREWALQLAARGNRKKATVALSRKIAVVLLSMWKSGSAYEPNGIRTGQEKLV